MRVTRYRVSASLEGMGTVTREVKVNIGTNVDIELRLTPQMSESVTVVAATPLVDTRDMGRPRW